MIRDLFDRRYAKKDIMAGLTLAVESVPDGMAVGTSLSPRPINLADLDTGSACTRSGAGACRVGARRRSQPRIPQPGELQQAGVSLDELIDEGRVVRTELLEEEYGITTDK